MRGSIQVVSPALNCELQFSTWPSFNSHIYRHHRDTIGLSNEISSEPLVTVTYQENEGITVEVDDQISPGRLTAVPERAT